MSNTHENELKREFLGPIGLLPFMRSVSSSRLQMFSSHIGQALVIDGATEAFIQTGMEREYAKYTLGVKMPVNAQVIKIIDRYAQKIGAGGIALNPQTVVLYENDDTKEVGMLDLRHFCSHHQYFGFRYKPTKHLSELRPYAMIGADTVLLNSPSVTPDGGYKFGIELNYAFMSHPATSEDGIAICEDVLPRLRFRTYHTRSVKFGSRRVPLNLYGDENNYKPFPEIGDFVRPDNLLIVLRDYDERFAAVQEDVYSLQKPNFFSDIPTYVPDGGGRIVDIRVWQDTGNQGPRDPAAPNHPDFMLEKYDRATKQFYQDLLAEYGRLKRERGETLRLTPELHRLVHEAIAIMDKGPDRIAKLYRNEPLDDWRVEFVIEYEITPRNGFKLTDKHGGK